jgi:hypothetical protein
MAQPSKSALLEYMRTKGTIAPSAGATDKKYAMVAAPRDVLAELTKRLSQDEAAYAFAHDSDHLWPMANTAVDGVVPFELRRVHRDTKFDDESKLNPNCGRFYFHNPATDRFAQWLDQSDWFRTRSNKVLPAALVAMIRDDHGLKVAEAIQSGDRPSVWAAKYAAMLDMMDASKSDGMVSTHELFKS